MGSASHDTDESSHSPNSKNPGKKDNSNVVYTPASTVSSKDNSVYGGEVASEPLADNGNNNAAVWGDWWKAEELAAQVGSLSKELTELKDVMIANKSLSLDAEANDMSRLKANHRSSLASLAEFHRSEMAGLNASHMEAMKKVELQHMEELRNARRTNGHDRDLVQGLHQSYSKQIESLVLDLSEARREVKELKLKQPSSDSTTETPRPIYPDVEELPNRTLPIKLTFENLDASLAVAELLVPHPGPSFNSLLRMLSFTVKNHLQTLNNTANFFLFRPREEHVEAALKIRHWYNSALEDRVHFSFTSPGATDQGTTMQERWEASQWKVDGFLLLITCTAEGWEDFTIPPLSPDALDNGPFVKESILSGLGLGMTTEKLVSTNNCTNESFNPTAALERINRELGKVQLQQEQADCDEDKENHAPMPSMKNLSRKATVESVQDEDEISRYHQPTSPPKPVPVVKTTKARQQTVEDASASIWEDGQPESAVRSINMSLEEGLKELLQKELFEKAFENVQSKGKARGLADSWLFDDDLFSPNSEVDQEKDESADASVYPQSTADETSTKAPPSLMDPLIIKDDSAKHPGFSWGYLSGNSTPPNPKLKTKVSQSTLPARDTWNMPNENSDLPARQTFTSGLFTFTGARSSPAPPPAPPAPEASIRDSPTIPSYAQTDVGTSHDQGESAHKNDDDPAETADDTPVMETAQSVVSSTPLLSDATGQRSVRFAGKKRSYPIDGASKRMPATPFPPASTGSPRGNESPMSSKYSASQYERQGYFRSGSNEAPEAPGGWSGSQSASEVSDYEPESLPGNKPRGFQQVSEPYSWAPREEDEEGDDDEEEEGGYRAASSPPLSRSSTTTTDHHNTGFIPPAYNQQPNNTLGTPFRYGFGGMMRPMSMGPLGPRGGIPAFSSPQHVDIIYQQIQRQKMIEDLRMRSGMSGGMEGLFANAAGSFGHPPRSSTAAPAFAGGPPVFAPNPPHSVAARSAGGSGGVPINGQYPTSQSNGSAVGGSVVNSSAITGISRYPFDNWPISQSNMPLHMAHRHQHRPSLFNSNGEVRRSFSNESLSPLLWGAGNQMAAAMRGEAEQQQMQIPVMPQQQHTPPNSNEQSGSYPGMMGPWQMSSNIAQMQSSTPVSQHSNHGAHGHGMPPATWFQQPNVPPFEVNWDGSMPSMPMRMPGPWSGYS